MVVVVTAPRRLVPITLGVEVHIQIGRSLLFIMLAQAVPRPLTAAKVASFGSTPACRIRPAAQRQPSILPLCADPRHGRRVHHDGVVGSSLR
jgi:hypothetical protein